MRKSIRHPISLAALAAVLAGLLAPAAVQVQAYPTRPIQVIIPFAGGSASDVVTRILLERTAKGLGQPFVIENRPGAGGNTGTQVAARATPDGYTLVATGSGPVVVNVALYADLGYNPAKDFEPIALVAQFPINVVVSSKLPVSSLGELITYAKARPGQLNFGSVGIGSSQHLGGAFFEQVTGVKLTHVPYRNIAQYGPDLMAGTVPLGFQWLPNVLGPINAGGAKPLAVASKTRLAALPNVPTTAEAGLPQYLASGWFVFLAPKGTPKPIITRLNEEVTAALKDPAVRARFTEQGAEPLIFTPDELGKFIAEETVRFRDVITKAGIEQIK